MFFQDFSSCLGGMEVQYRSRYLTSRSELVSREKASSLSSDRESVIFEETLEKRDSRIAIPRKFVKLVIAYKAFNKQFN